MRFFAHFAPAHLRIAAHARPVARHLRFDLLPGHVGIETGGQFAEGPGARGADFVDVARGGMEVDDHWGWTWVTRGMPRNLRTAV